MVRISPWVAFWVGGEGAIGGVGINGSFGWSVEAHNSGCYQLGSDDFSPFFGVAGWDDEREFGIGEVDVR